MKTYQQVALKRPWFFVFEKKLKKHVEVASIIHALKLYQKCILKWRRLFAHQNCIKTVCQNGMEIRRYWRVDKILTLIQQVESVGITEQNWFYCQPKIIVVSTLIFDVVLRLINWHCLNVEIQLAISSTLI